MTFQIHKIDKSHHNVMHSLDLRKKPKMNDINHILDTTHWSENVNNHVMRIFESQLNVAVRNILLLHQKQVII